MKVGLASYRLRDGDLAYNLSQVEKGLRAAEGKLDLLCFGESFLQGFNAVTFCYEVDRKLAITRDSAVMQRLCELTRDTGVDLLLGYLEREGECLYSACALLGDGRLLHNYRRMSQGWKLPGADEHYREGDSAEEFLCRGHRFQVALCGDLFVFPERFRSEHTLLWPVYVDIEREEWPEAEKDYALQAQKAARRTLMVNPLSEEPPCHGGAFDFADGEIINRIPYDREEILTVEL